MSSNVYKAKDIAQHILVKKDVKSTFKLQKLLFFAQSISLYLFDEPLFAEKIEAYDNGPVVSTVLTLHKYMPELLYSTSDRCDIDTSASTVIDLVIKFFGHKSKDELVYLTHREDGAWDKVYVKDKNYEIPRELIKEEMSYYKDFVDYMNSPVVVDKTKVPEEIKDILKDLEKNIEYE